MTTKTALVTGASSGIGAAIARQLAAQGFRLVLNARRQERLEALADSLRKEFSCESYLLPFDIRSREAVQQAIAGLPAGWKNIQVLINNAGLAAGLSSIEEGNLDDWEQMIDTNVKGLLYVSRTVIPLMIAAGQGHVINIGSIAGKEVYANGNVYCSTKHAVDALNRSMRIDLAKYPIKVSAVNPGAVETEFSIVRFKGDTERAAKVYEGFENLVADDIADAVWYILSRPAHVNINDLVIMPTAQPCAGVIHRKAK